MNFFIKMALSALASSIHSALGSGLRGLGAAEKPLSEVSTSPSGFFDSVSCASTIKGLTCTAVGFNESDSIDYNPVLAESNNDLSSWSQTNITGMPQIAAFNAVDCVTLDNSIDISCVGVGEYQEVPGRLSALLVERSNGSDWTITPVPGTEYLGQLFAVDCDPTGFCAAAGTNGTNPLIATRSNVELSWTSQTISDSSLIGATLKEIKCASNGVNRICVALGGSISEMGFSRFLAQSINGGSWVLMNIDYPYSSDVQLYAVDCAYNNVFTCVAVGTDGYNEGLFVAVMDAEGNWTGKSLLPRGQAFGQFNTISCFPNNKNITYVAAGQSWQGPTLFISEDSGENWEQKNITGAPSFGLFNSVRCISQPGKNVSCAAVGENDDAPPNQQYNGAPLVAVSTDNAATWTIANVTGAPQGWFSSVDGAPDMSGSISWAAVGGVGVNPPEGNLLLAQSKAGGPWTSVALSSTKRKSIDAALSL